jgi:hypothetical protein
MKFDAGTAYYYLLFDMCYVTVDSVLQISIIKQSGKHSLEVNVHIDRIQDFNVNCLAPESDAFLSRQYHGACETFNHNIWTFGGKGAPNENGTQILNSLAYYTDSENKWVSVEPQSKIVPEPRFALGLF